MKESFNILQETIENILHEINFGSRQSKIETILLYADFKNVISKEDFIKLAMYTDDQLNYNLSGLIRYYLNNFEI